MAYFSSGTEGMDYEERYCIRCVHSDHHEENHPPCQIWMLHQAHNYNEDWRLFLNALIPMNGAYPGQCTMFVER
jgi:hypothetical protein